MSFNAGIKERQSLNKLIRGKPQKLQRQVGFGHVINAENRER